MDDTPRAGAAVRALRPAEETTRDYWLARVAEAGPLAEAAAPEADRARRLAPETMEALHERGLFRLLLPRAVNGHEISLPDYFQVIEAIASYDASTAWCVTQGNCCAMVGGYLDLEVSQNIWGRDPEAILAWGPGPTEAAEVEGGFRITARSSFASGSRYATWLGVHIPGARGPETLTFLFPAAETTLIENWDVLGLRGTGSDSFEIKDLFVAEEYSVARATMAENRPPHGEGTLYAFPQMPVHAMGFAATALGTARGFVSAFLDVAQKKVPRLHSASLRDNAVVQDEVGHAEARLSAARAFMLQEIDAAWDVVGATGRLPVENRMRIRLSSTHAIRESKAIVDTLFDSAGTSSVFADSPFERRFRDVHMIAQQIQGRKAHYGSVGAWLLGHDPDMTVI